MLAAEVSTILRARSSSPSAAHGIRSRSPRPAAMWSAASLPTLALKNCSDLVFPVSISVSVSAHFRPASSSSTIALTRAPCSGLRSARSKLAAPPRFVVATPPSDSTANTSCSPSTMHTGLLAATAALTSSSRNSAVSDPLFGLSCQNFFLPLMS